MKQLIQNKTSADGIAVVVGVRTAMPTVKAKICLMQPFFWQIKKLNIIHKTLLTYL
jgi:hypothetical protein